MAPPKTSKDREALNNLYKMLKPHSAGIKNFPKNETDFAALSAEKLDDFAYKAQSNILASGDDNKFEKAIKATDKIVSKKEAEELDSLYTELAKAGLNARKDGFPDKENFAKLNSEEIEELANIAIKSKPELATSIGKLLKPVLEIKHKREQKEEELFQELNGRPFSERDSLYDDLENLQPSTATIKPSQKYKNTKRAETEEHAPKKENNRVTFKDAMELKNESIKEKNAEQTWKGNLANRIKGVGRVLYAVPAIPIEGAKGIFNAVRSVPVMAGGAAKAAWGAIRGNQELKENGISMMSAGGHMALQGVTAFVRAPASLIVEGLGNIVTGQRQENTFRAKQQATRLTREKGKGNLDLKDNDLSHSSKTTQKIVEKMRSTSQIQQGSHVQQSASTGKGKNKAPDRMNL